MPRPLPPLVAPPSALAYRPLSAALCLLSGRPIDVLALTPSPRPPCPAPPPAGPSQVFKAKSQEFLDTLHSLLGYRILFSDSGDVRLNTTYAPRGKSGVTFRFASQEGHFGSMAVTGGLAKTLDELREFWVTQRQEVPCFLASVTLELYDRSTVRLSPPHSPPPPFPATCRRRRAPPADPRPPLARYCRGAKPPAGSARWTTRTSSPPPPSARRLDPPDLTTRALGARTLARTIGCLLLAAPPRSRSRSLADPARALAGRTCARC